MIDNRGDRYMIGMMMEPGISVGNGPDHDWD